MTLKFLEPQGGTERTSATPAPDEILEQLDLITASPLFSRSKRYPSFLRYIVERTLSGEVDQLKERTLGVEVFNRPSDYDTNTDPVVRITAGEIRKRLAQYYGEPGHGHQLRVELPLGSYAPLFSRPAGHPQGLHAGFRPLEPEAALLPGASLGSAWPDEVSPPPSSSEPDVAHSEVQPGAGVVNADTATADRSRGTRLLRLLVASFACLFFFALLIHLAQSALTQRRERGLAAFWQSVLHAEAPALIVVGVHAFGPDGKELAPLSGEGQGSTMLTSMTSTNMVPLSDLVAYSRITDLLTTHSHAYRTQSSAQTTFEQLQPGPVVLIGGLDNIWTLRLLAPLRFHFDGQFTMDGRIEDATHPGTVWRFNNAQSSHAISRDYAIVASFFDPAIEQRVVVAAGIGRNGTAAATRFLTNTRQLEAWVSKLPQASDGNVELVLSTDIVEGEQGPAHIVASYTW